MIIPIILSGGNGTRLWPLSRKSRPKQFIKLLNGETLFTQTIKRFEDRKVFSNPIILGNINHEKLIEKEIENNNLKDSYILFEPIAKNTAPAIAMLVEYLYNSDKKDDVVVFVASDAYINNIDLFKNCLLEGEKIAENNKVVCFGVQPFYPETGYGYIKLGTKINGNSFLVDKFVEKPNIETANRFLKSNKYLWNAGIFMSKISVLYELFKKFKPNLLSNSKLTISKSKIDKNKIYFNQESFNNFEDISIDYAIIENLHEEDLAVISMNLIWSDIGSYKSLFDIDKDKNDGNNIIQGNAILNNVDNCFIRSDKKTIFCSDIDDLVIIEDNEAILVMKKNKSQNIKKLIEKIKEANMKEFL